MVNGAWFFIPVVVLLGLAVLMGADPAVALW